MVDLPQMEKQLKHFQTHWRRFSRTQTTGATGPLAQMTGISEPWLTKRWLLQMETRLSLIKAGASFLPELQLVVETEVLAVELMFTAEQAAPVYSQCEQLSL